MSVPELSVLGQPSLFEPPCLEPDVDVTDVDVMDVDVPDVDVMDVDVMDVDVPDVAVMDVAVMDVDVMDVDVMDVDVSECSAPVAFGGLGVDTQAWPNYSRESLQASLALMRAGAAGAARDFEDALPHSQSRLDAFVLACAQLSGLGVEAELELATRPR